MPCHVLLAFYQSFESAAYRIVKELGIGANEVIKQIESVYPQQPQLSGKPTVSAATQQLLQGAIDQAEVIGHMYVGTEHLVLGMATTHDAVTQAIFEGKGLTLEAVREQVRKALRATSNGRELLSVGVPNTVDGMYQMASWSMILAGIKPPPPPTASLPNPITDAERQAKIRRRFEADITNMTALVARFSTHPATNAMLRKRGLAYMWLARYDASIADLTRAIEAAPNDVENYLVRMVAYELQGKFDLALKDCNPVILIAPRNKTAFSCRATVYMQQHVFDKAAADLEAAYMLVPDPTEYELGYAQLAYQRGEFTTSAEKYRHVLSRILAISPPRHSYNLGIIHYYFGKSLDALGDVDGAVDSFKQARNQWSLPPLKRPQAWLVELHEYIEKHRPQQFAS